MKDLLCDAFQNDVKEYLIRHRSIIDVLSKFLESNARVNRAISKAVTSCGCIKIVATKQKYPSEGSLVDLRNYVQTHLEGSLCEHCREIVESELGNNLFYIAALCNLLDLNMYDVLLKEDKKLSQLGFFNLA
ncbi:MAG: DUF1573 domain-containing protein [Bacillota bacterium]